MMMMRACCAPRVYGCIWCDDAMHLRGLSVWRSCCVLRLKQLTFNPVAEQDQLRMQPALAEITAHQLAANSSLSLDKGKWPKGSASQSEVWVKFKLPSATTELGIKLMVCALVRPAPRPRVRRGPGGCLTPRTGVAVSRGTGG